MALLVLLVLEQLGLAGPTTSAGVLMVLAALPLAALVALGLGGRETAENILAAHMLRSHFSPGDRVGIDGIEGTVICVGWSHTRVEDQSGTLVIPNSRLARATTLRLHPPDQAK